jgi:hypothetical protein
MQQNPLLDVEIPPLRPLARQVQRADRQHRAHDIVARQALLDHVVAPEGPDAHVGGQGGVGFGREVVEELQLEEREVGPAAAAAIAAAAAAAAVVVVVREEGGRGRV